MLLEQLKKRVLVFDGAMGTQLQNIGLKAGDIPEEYNITRKEDMIRIHKSYLDAGADFISTNTFGCSPYKMADSLYELEDLITHAIDNANQAKIGVDREVYIAYDMGPIGQLLEPMGTLSFDEAYEQFKVQVEFAKDKVDAFIVETMTDIYEVKAAILAIKETCDLPIIVSMTFEANGRSLTGTDPLTFVNVVEGLGADVLGVNCSLGPKELLPIVEEILAVARIPMIVQPNAGLPCLEHGETHYHLTSEEYAMYAHRFVEMGVSIIGGCCGTTPAFIQEAKKASELGLHFTPAKKKTRVSSGSKTVTFENQVIVCGERLNPTGKKKLKQALLDEKYDEVLREAIHQQEAGADILDVNVGVPGIDESQVMTKVVKMIQEVINLPLQMDSSSPEALEKACRYYNGRPLINSINAKPEVMHNILPIAKKYGGVVIGLTLADQIPLLASERVQLAKDMIKQAEAYGIHPKDVIIDCLTLTASAQQKEVQETLRALQMVKELGHHTVLGVSNVSFGLPNRPLLNRTFLTMAMQAGLDLPIINPLDFELMSTIDAFNVITNQDVDSTKYIAHQANVTVEKKVVQHHTNTTQSFDQMSLYDAIIRGLKDEVHTLATQELETKQPLDIVQDIVIPALNQVGDDYESGKIFLPQLIQSAETTKVAFEVLQSRMQGSSATKKGPIIMATVEGDIHDIGKNIVKVVLESYGYEVIDLGKNVPVQSVVDAFLKYKPKAIGLSALMTTTVVSMKKTIEALRQYDEVCPIMVGGAVLTQEIADEIHADYYGVDAMATVKIVQQIIG
ncbi:5-methyltetrahydrofolate--homocysteine methyltransferase [Breznakia blatticola]|uniref:Methionine synthase n=1 Tax=Breznakia blatticola TaxID=1754012 RepID=A0A4R8A8S7_9FIRM|nr:homocysteine S-methyltransferase family protein [Breznakia blatticola]TDW26314.1 5-methyltetrahydrofolate--homocysteine methyltransferase [Breznakia blatticola]